MTEQEVCLMDYQSSSSNSLPSQYCLVCSEPANGAHFGASACRACAAFFRRTVQLDKKHSCPKNEQCSLVSSVRNMCRLCRYKKCLAVGMQSCLVQQKRDQLGKRETILKPSSSGDLVCNNRESSIIDKLYKAYKSLEKERETVHNRTEGQVPRAISYIELKVVYARELGIVYKFICSTFPEYAECSPDLKRALFKNFYLPFTLLESAYFGYINEKPDLMIIPSGDYVDLMNIETYFSDENKVFSKEETMLMFTKQFSGIKMCLISSMKAENIDIFEFLVLVAMLMWERDVESEYDKTLTFEKVLDIRSVLVQDLLHHYNSSKLYKDATLRLGNILTMLSFVQRVTNKFQEYVEMKDLFDVYSLPRNLYDMFTPTKY